jgi:hypothetical protein
LSATLIPRSDFQRVPSHRAHIRTPNTVVIELSSSGYYPAIS